MEFQTVHLKSDVSSLISDNSTVRKGDSAVFVGGGGGYSPETLF